MIAIGIGTIRCGSAEGRRTVGIGARHHHHSDAIGERAQFTARERTCNGEHRLAPRGLIAVLQTDQPDDRAAKRRDRCGIGEPFGGRDEIGDFAALLRLAERTRDNSPGGLRQCGNEILELLLAGEIVAPARETRCLELDRHIGKMRENRRRLAV